MRRKGAIMQKLKKAEALYMEDVRLKEENRSPDGNGSTCNPLVGRNGERQNRIGTEMDGDLSAEIIDQVQSGWRIRVS